jgi:hypothetical protein
LDRDEVPEKDRTRRYDTANGLASDIRRHLNNEAVLARPASAAYRFQKMVRRNKLPFAAATAVAAALLIGLGAATIMFFRERVARNGEQQQRLEARQAQKVAETERERAKQEAASRRVQLYAAEVNLAGETLDEDHLNRARELLARQIPAPGETNDLRGFEWRYLWQQSQSAELTTLGQHETGVHGVRFSPDGTLLASSEINGTVKLWDYRARKLVTLRDPTIQPIDGDDSATKALAFSPDGGRLAVGVGRDIVLWEVASHERIAVLKVTRIGIFSLRPTAKPGERRSSSQLWDVTPANLVKCALPLGFVVVWHSLLMEKLWRLRPVRRSSAGNYRTEAPVELPPLEARTDIRLGDGHRVFSRTNLLISADTGGT